MEPNNRLAGRLIGEADARSRQPGGGYFYSLLSNESQQAYDLAYLTGINKQLLAVKEKEVEAIKQLREDQRKLEQQRENERREKEAKEARRRKAEYDRRQLIEEEIAHAIDYLSEHFYDYQEKLKTAMDAMHQEQVLEFLFYSDLFLYAEVLEKYASIDGYNRRLNIPFIKHNTVFDFLYDCSELYDFYYLTAKKNPLQFFKELMWDSHELINQIESKLESCLNETIRTKRPRFKKSMKFIDLDNRPNASERLDERYFENKVDERGLHIAERLDLIVHRSLEIPVMTKSELENKFKRSMAKLTDYIEALKNKKKYQDLISKALILVDKKSNPLMQSINESLSYLVESDSVTDTCQRILSIDLYERYYQDIYTSVIQTMIELAEKKDRLINKIKTRSKHPELGRFFSNGFRNSDDQYAFRDLFYNHIKSILPNHRVAPLISITNPDTDIDLFDSDFWLYNVFCARYICLFKIWGANHSTDSYNNSHDRQLLIHLRPNKLDNDWAKKDYFFDLEGHSELEDINTTYIHLGTVRSLNLNIDYFNQLHEYVRTYGFVSFLFSKLLAHFVFLAIIAYFFDLNYVAVFLVALATSSVLAVSEREDHNKKIIRVYSAQMIEDYANFPNKYKSRETDQLIESLKELNKKTQIKWYDNERLFFGV